jgi:hypothetical protein
MKPSISIPLVPVLAFALLAPACASSTPQARIPITPIDVRESQTRFLENTTSVDAMKAVIDMLQDSQFSIERTDAALGLVIATRSTSKKTMTAERQVLKWATALSTYGIAALFPWGQVQTVQLEASINVTPAGQGSRVRVTLNRKVLDQNGRLKKAENVSDVVVYRDLFEQLERSVFVADAR